MIVPVEPAAYLKNGALYLHANQSYTEVVQAAKVSQDCKIDKRKRVEIRTVFRA